MRFNLGAITGNFSHIHTLMDLLGDTFGTGFSKRRGQEDPRAQYSKMLDEAIVSSTRSPLRAILTSSGMSKDDVDDAYSEMGEFFADHPEYIEAFREMLAAISDPSACVATFKEFVEGNDSHKMDMCIAIDQRSTIVKLVINKLVTSRRTWKRVLKKELELEEAEKVQEFLSTLSPVQRMQFRASIGGMIRNDDRSEMLDEVLRRHPEMDRMKELSITRGLIKEDDSTLNSVQIHIAEAINSLFEGDDANVREFISQGARNLLGAVYSPVRHRLFAWSKVHWLKIPFVLMGFLRLPAVTDEEIEAVDNPRDSAETQAERLFRLFNFVPAALMAVFGGLGLWLENSLLYFMAAVFSGLWFGGYAFISHLLNATPSVKKQYNGLTTPIAFSVIAWMIVYTIDPRGDEKFYCFLFVVAYSALQMFAWRYAWPSRILKPVAWFVTRGTTVWIAVRIIMPYAIPGVWVDSVALVNELRFPVQYVSPEVVMYYDKGDEPNFGEEVTRQEYLKVHKTGLTQTNGLSVYAQSIVPNQHGELREDAPGVHVIWTLGRDLVKELPSNSKTQITISGPRSASLRHQRTAPAPNPSQGGSSGLMTLRPIGADLEVPMGTMIFPDRNNSPIYTSSLETNADVWVKKTGLERLGQNNSTGVEVTLLQVKILNGTAKGEICWIVQP